MDNKPPWRKRSILSREFFFCGAREIHPNASWIFLFSDWLMFSPEFFLDARSANERHKGMTTNKIAFQNVTKKFPISIIEWKSKVKHQVFHHDNIITSPQRTQGIHRWGDFASSCIRQEKKGKSYWTTVIVMELWYTESFLWDINFLCVLVFLCVWYTNLLSSNKRIC